MNTPEIRTETKSIKPLVSLYILNWDKWDKPTAAEILAIYRTGAELGQSGTRKK